MATAPDWMDALQASLSQQWTEIQDILGNESSVASDDVLRDLKSLCDGATLDEHIRARTSLNGAIAPSEGSDHVSDVEMSHCDISEAALDHEAALTDERLPPSEQVRQSRVCWDDWFR